MPAKGHLEHKLAKWNKARTVRHLPALPYAEMGAFMAALRAVNSIAARALELTILCATRTNETLGAISFVPEPMETQPKPVEEGWICLTPCH
jgi:hypothetical protein